MTGAANIRGGIEMSLPTTSHPTGAFGSKAMIAVTSGAAAIPGLVEALRERQMNAMDAALSAAFSQIVMCAGSWVSFAGIMNCAHFDPRSGTVEFLDAGFDLPRGETRPRTIPKTGTRNGRSALVPGFMAGAQAAHERYGSADWNDIVAPSLALAHGGVEVTETLARLIDFRAEVLLGSDEGRAIFQREGRLAKVGDVLAQNELAGLLDSVATQGAGVLTRGDWAQRMVANVRAAGGKLDLQDLEGYSANWTPPDSVRYGAFDVSVAPPPQLGGVCLREALASIGSGRLSGMGHYASSPEALIQVLRASHLCYARFLTDTSSAPVGAAFESADGSGPKALSLADRLTGFSSRAPHSDVVVAADPDGCLAVICHSINTTAWGTTGLFVDGVSIPDSAAFQQSLLARIPSGGRVPNALCPAIITSDDAVIGLGGIGGSVSETMLQTTVNLLDYGKSLEAAAHEPMVLRAVWPAIGRFQVFMFGAGGLVFLPAAALSVSHIWSGYAIPPSLVMLLASLANLGFAAAIVAAVRLRCRRCITSLDRTVLFFLLGVCACLSAVWTIASADTGPRTSLAFLLAAGLALIFTPLLRASLVPVNLIEPGVFPSDLLRAARKAGLVLREIRKDPPYGYWAGVRHSNGQLEGAVSPNSLDGTAIGR